MRRLFKALTLICFILLSALVYNASFWAEVPSYTPQIVHHRGMHQLYDRKGLDASTCTASRIYAPVHDYLENTMPSMEEAFRRGADYIEIDIHPTLDGEFVVFHDWTLDCRTNGTGVTREKTLAELQSLDIGYGYTHDDGETFPFRAKFIGAMPSLKETLTRYPEKKFVINFKGNQPDEALKLMEYLKSNNLQTDNFIFYGSQDVIDKFKELNPLAQTFSKSKVQHCISDYWLWGWTGRVPNSCQNETIIVPINLRYIYWGWPNLFFKRMEEHNVRVIISGNVSRNGLLGLEHQKQMDKLPKNFNGHIWVERPLHR